jgi:hypothetical protein
MSNDLGQVEREVRATMARPRHTLPEAWNDPEAIARMGDWIDRFVAPADRQTFQYGFQS